MGEEKWEGRRQRSKPSTWEAPERRGRYQRAKKETLRGQETPRRTARKVPPGNARNVSREARKAQNTRSHRTDKCSLFGGPIAMNRLRHAAWPGIMGSER